MSAREIRRDLLWDMLVSSPDGTTVDDMCTSNSWSHRQTNDAIHDLRAYLGEYDDLTLVCDPQGSGERWLYRLVGRLDDVKGWVDNRVKDADSRLRTMQLMMQSIVSATNARTIEGRRARVMERALRRLVEDLDDLII